MGTASGPGLAKTQLAITECCVPVPIRTRTRRSPLRTSEVTRASRFLSWLLPAL